MHDVVIIIKIYLRGCMFLLLLLLLLLFCLSLLKFHLVNPCCCYCCWNFFLQIHENFIIFVICQCQIYFLLGTTKGISSIFLVKLLGCGPST